MRIGIMGAGSVGAALGRGWAARGHEVTFGVREPKDRAAAVKGGVPAGARVASLADAARGADLVVLAVPAGAIADAAAVIGPVLRSGAVVIDASNPVGAGLQLQTGPQGESQAERTQALLPGARVVKTLNQTGANNIGPTAAGAFTPRPVMFVAGDDAQARATARGLVEDLGFEGVEAGPLIRARELERLAMLWIVLAATPATGLGRDFVLAIVRK